MQETPQHKETDEKLNSREIAEDQQQNREVHELTTKTKDKTQTVKQHRPKITRGCPQNDPFSSRNSSFWEIVHNQGKNKRKIAQDVKKRANSPQQPSKDTNQKDQHKGKCEVGPSGPYVTLNVPTQKSKRRKRDDKKRKC